jgi:hypothetical protein
MSNADISFMALSLLNRLGASETGLNIPKGKASHVYAQELVDNGLGVIEEISPQVFKLKSPIKFQEQIKDWKFKELKEMPTIHQGHFENLKIESPTLKVWLMRGEGERTVRVCRPAKPTPGVPDWITVLEYQAH